MTSDIHTLAGAYAVHALPDDERSFFEQHLSACESCDVEVNEFLATTAVLGAASTEPPPTLLRQRVLRAVDVTRQAAPVPQTAPCAPRPGRRLVEALLGSVAGILAVAVLALSGVSVHLNDRVDELETALPAIAIDDRALAVLAASDAQTRALEGDGPAAARFVYSPSLDTGVFIAHDMRPLPAHSTYELWLFHDGVPQPATIFAPDTDGRVLAVVEGSVAGAQFAAVTVEPHGGSTVPTGDVVAQGSV